MSQRIPLQDEWFESRLIRRRLILSALFVLVLILLLLVRLVMLQINDYEYFMTLSDSNRVHIKALPPARGLIFDRNGIVMANNLPSYRLEVVHEQVDDLAATLLRLQSYIDLSEQDKRRFQQVSRHRRPFERVPLKLNLNDDEVARLAVNLHRLDGVEINARLTRHYPQGKHAVHVLGYVSQIDEQDLNDIDSTDYAGTSHIGKIGLEKYYEDELHGQVGVQQVEVNARGRTLRILNETPPIHGNNLHLTIDSKLQRATEIAFGDRVGAAVVIKPDSGEVLALVSMPTFDPNLFVNGISFKQYSRLRESSYRPLFNRALSGQYPPGSITKPFYGLAGLEAGTIHSQETQVCRGYYLLPNEERRYRDWKKTGHGVVTVQDAITQSCDVYFYSLAHQLGIDKMSAFMTDFGFGIKTGIDSIGENAGLMPSREWKLKTQGVAWFPGETLITMIGQGAMLATPLQLANSMAAFANKGRRYKPYLVSSIDNSGTGFSRKIHSGIAGEYTIKRDLNWQHIHNSMIDVVHDSQGTAQQIGVDINYKIAGKTGTAQVFGIAQDEEYDAEAVGLNLRDHALFVSYAPADKPEIAIAVIVENGGHGGSVAAPIARQVMDAYFGGGL